MAEIIKVTTPMIPRENLGSRNKPVSDQAFELTDPSKVHRGEDGKILDHREGQSAQWDILGRDRLGSVLRSVTDVMHTIQRIAMMIQTGISTSDVVNNSEVQQLLEELYLSPGQLTQALLKQDSSSVMFKGAAFDILRDIMAKFPESPRIQGAVAQLLKTFEHNINAENSIRTILLTCNNLLDYMFSGDRTQFAEYLEGLGEILLPETIEEAPQQQATVRGGQQQPAAEGQTTVVREGVQQPTPEQQTAVQKDGQPASERQAQASIREDGQPALERQAQASEDGQQPASERAGRSLGVEHREAAQILKGNLLPLLGEIVVKYNQSDRIRDMVMVVIHNIVRVDQGTPEAMREAAAKLSAELRLVANLPDSFEKHINDAIFAAKDQVRSAQNQTLSKLTTIISETLLSTSSNPAVLRQAENLLVSLLQNQNAAMNVLHFMLPMETEQGKLFAEMYVDPDSEEKVGRSQERSRKIFLAFDSDHLGAFELSFVEAGERVDFSMWCPEMLVQSLSSIKRQNGDIMQLHGYTMNSYHVSELVAPKSIADVFPRLLDRRMGVDVRI